MLKQHFNCVILESQEGLRLDKAVSELFPSISRTKIKKSIKSKLLQVNGDIISDSKRIVKFNDKIEFDIIETTISDQIIPANIKLDIVYEDDDLIIINKPKNMTVHAGAGTKQDTLVNALLYHTQNLSTVPNAKGEIRPGIVHRLDRDTSGLMVVAKNNPAHVHLAKQIQTRELIRKYSAIIWGVIKPHSGEINKNIGRNRRERTQMTTLEFGGKHAITHYETKEIFCKGLFSLVECKLDTGRTHQIRVHLSSIGHSIVGDQTYGNNHRKTSQLQQEQIQCAVKMLDSQALHSVYMSFIHPTNDRRMEFESALHDDMRCLIESLRGVMVI